MRRPLILATALAVATISPSALAIGSLAGGSVDPAALAVPTTPASLRGLADDATVNVFTAQASYTVPFDVPSGPGGAKPSLALAYEGSLGNGPFGVGFSWSIPHVRRSTRLGVPTYGAGDELELVGVKGGGRLIEAGDGTLRLEGQGNRVKVIRSGGALIVQDGDGVEYLLGFTPATRVVDGARVFAWMVQQILYPSGQSVNFVYTRSGGNLGLSTVRWGPRGVYGVDVVYEPRPDRFTSYRSGFPVEHTGRVARVDVLSNGQVLRRILFGYDDSLPLSRLVRVEQRGVGGQGVLPAVTFGYGAAQAARAVAMPGTGGWSLTNSDTTLFDVDGDGVTDLVRFAGARHTYRRNLGTSFGAEAPIPSDIAGAAPALSGSRLLGMEGKGRPDLVRVMDGRWVVQRLAAGRWVTVGPWQNTANLTLLDPGVDFADINGDGRADRIESLASDLRVRLNGDRAFQSTTQGTSPAPNLIPGTPGVDFQDMNGDGLADVVVMRSDSALVYAGRGDGTFVTTPVTIAYPASLVTNDVRELRLGDLNNDGVADFVRVSSAAVLWFPMRPGGTFMADATGAPISRSLARPQGVTFDAVVAIADANGNGSQDVVWSSPQGLWVLDLAGTTSAAMLTRVDNGLGKTMTFAYEASARLALSAELDPAVADWVERLPVSIPVPTEIRTVLASGGKPRITRLASRDGFWDGEERRFGGFLQVTRREEGDTPAATLVETTTFHAGRGADRALRGSPLTIERRDGAGVLLSSEENAYTPLAIVGLPAGEPRLRLPARTLNRVRHHEGQVTPLVVESSFAYDGDGNVSVETRSGVIGGTVDDYSVRRTYAQSDARWVRGRLVEESVLDRAGAVVRRTRRLYDGGTVPLAAGQVDRGWLRRLEAEYREGARWIPQETFDYDAVGNPVTTTRQGVTRTLSYDPDQLHVVREDVHPDAKTTLAWTVTSWDPVQDKPLATADPNGVVSSFTYDTLGRLTSVAKDGAAPHVSYAYAWAAPRPRVTTTTTDGPAGSRTRVDVFDGAGAPLYRATRFGAGYVVDEFVTRDARGLVQQRAEPFQTSAVALPTALPANASVTLEEHDALGRITRVVRPNGAQTVTTRGPLREVTKGDGLAAIEVSMDGHGRVVDTRRVVGGAVLEKTWIHYDALGNVIDYNIQSSSSVHKYGYDSLGRLVSSSDPERGVQSFTYDDANRVTGAKNALGETTTSRYDGVGRIVSRVGSDGTAYAYTYDAPSASCRYTLGRLSFVTEPTGRLDLSYDAFGRVVRRARSISGQTAVETSTFSPAGLLVAQSFDDGLQLSYGYDAAGRLEAIQSGAGPAVDEWRRLAVDASGRVLRERFRNGLEQSTERDPLGLPSRVTVGRPAAPALLDVSIAQRTAYGAPLSVVDLDGVGADHSATYAYDDAARVTAAQVAGLSFAYTYDPLQNLTSRTATGGLPRGMLSGAYKYDAAKPRQLVSAGGTALRHDAAGRITAIGATTLTYDPFDHLRTVIVAGGGTVDHRYGHDGERTMTRSAAGVVERRFSAGDVERGGTRQHTLRVGDRLVARLDRRAGAAIGSTYLHSTLGPGPALLTDAAGAVVEERLFEPFGAPIAFDVRRDPHGSGNKPVDPDTGWSDHGARWLMAETGRWSSADPLSLTPSASLARAPWRLNPYGYAANNPLLFWDPDGREEMSWGSFFANLFGIQTGPTDPIAPTVTTQVGPAGVEVNQDGEVKVTAEAKVGNAALTLGVENKANGNVAVSAEVSAEAERGGLSASFKAGVELVIGYVRNNGYALGRVTTYTEQAVEAKVDIGPVEVGLEAAKRNVVTSRDVQFRGTDAIRANRQMLDEAAGFSEPTKTMWQLTQEKR